jgi:hypothetical protein
MARVKRRRGILLAVLGLGLVTMLVVVPWPRENEPEYQGKTLSQWLATYMENGQASPQAADAVHHIGTNALPFLVKWIAHEQPKWRDKLADKMLRVPIPLARATVGPLLGTRRVRAGVAVFGFEILREEAAPVVPALTKLMQDWRFPNRGDRAVLALVYIGKDALPALFTVMTNTEAPPKFRCRVARCITDPMMNLGTNAVRAVPTLLLCLEDPGVASCVAQVLGILNLAPEEVVPALAKCLRSPEISVRVEAAKALGEFYSRASPAVPDLLVAANDNTQLVRVAAINGLIKSHPAC